MCRLGFKLLAGINGGFQLSLDLAGVPLRSLLGFDCLRAVGLALIECLLQLNELGILLGHHFCGVGFPDLSLF